VRDKNGVMYSIMNTELAFKRLFIPS